MFHRLPREVQLIAVKQYRLWEVNPNHRYKNQHHLERSFPIHCLIKEENNNLERSKKVGKRKLEGLVEIFSSV